LNVNVKISLQLLYPDISVKEDDNTMRFINRLNGASPRSNLTSINNHMYMIGNHKAVVFTDMLAQAFHCPVDSVHNTFPKLYKNGIIYSSRSRTKSNSKRNDAVCIFKNDSGDEEFGIIELFVTGSCEDDATALVFKLICKTPSILHQAGHPCRAILLDYQQADLLKHFIVPVELQFSTLTAVNASAICGKVVLITVGLKCFCNFTA